MSITHLPKVGSITEKSLADYWTGALPINGSIARKTDAGPLHATGLVVYANYIYGTEAFVVDGYFVSIGDDDDLTVTLPASSVSYVYLVLDMAGGGTNTVGQRLMYYSAVRYIPHSLLIARVLTGTDSVLSFTYLCHTGSPDICMYPQDYGSATSTMGILAANTERSTTSTDAVLIKQATVEYRGVYGFSIDMKRSSGTATCYVYCASTGLSSPQLTLTSTSGTYENKAGTIYCTEGDIVYIYLKSSNASYTAYGDDAEITGYYGTPMAPAFLTK